MKTIVSKLCARCKEEKQISEFYNEDLRVLGEGKYCRNCLLIALKISSSSNKIPKKSFSKNQHRYDKMRKTKATALREIVLENYGSKCGCCRESNYEFLAIDHVNGDGAKMRRNKEHPATGYSLYKWIIENNFPKIFRILCHNCNQSLGIYGYCPHEKTHI